MKNSIGATPTVWSYSNFLITAKHANCLCTVQVIEARQQWLLSLKQVQYITSNACVFVEPLALEDLSHLNAHIHNTISNAHNSISLRCSASSYEYNLQFKRD